MRGDRESELRSGLEQQPGRVLPQAAVESESVDD